MDCKSNNNSDRFYANIVLPKSQAKITDFGKKAYHDYFGVKVGGHDEPLALHVSSKKMCG